MIAEAPAPEVVAELVRASPQGAHRVTATMEGSAADLAAFDQTVCTPLRAAKSVASRPPDPTPITAS
jgi:hypothetical protein